MGGRINLKGTLASRFYLGDVYDCQVSMNGMRLRVITGASDFEDAEDIQPGSEVNLAIREFLVFEDDGSDEQLRIVT